MSESAIISKIRKFTIKNSETDDIHGFLHVERVYKTCINLGNRLGANILVLKISALLHDIGRIKEKENSNNTNHAEISSQMALDFLKSNNLKISQENIDNIIHCIKAHSFSNKTNPKTIEAKILSDADKLDAIGAIGLYRTIGYTVKNNGGIDQVIKHLENKIMKLKDQMYLDVSKKFAKDRQHIILDFYNKIRNEK